MRSIVLRRIQASCPIRGDPAHSSPICLFGFLGSLHPFRRTSCYNSLVGRRGLASLSSNESYRLFKVAIVGSGPSGCYTAKYLQAALLKHQETLGESVGENNEGGTSTMAPLAFEIDIIERLPTPYGLVRYGVAPDHPEVKNVQNDFDSLFNDANTKISLYCNVNVGQDISVAELRQMYHAVVLAYGCESDRKLDKLPGSNDLSGILSAREFVAWYNGHPDFQHIGDEVAKALKAPKDKQNTAEDRTDFFVHNANVVVIGQGNVALDCARIMAKGSVGLYETDISSNALSVLRSGVSNVTVVGRRGHVQGAFTIKEVRELINLQHENASTRGDGEQPPRENNEIDHQSDNTGIRFIVRQEELEHGTTDASLQEMEGTQGRPAMRIDKLLRKNAVSESERLASSRLPMKKIEVRFLLNPIRFEADPRDPTRLGTVVCERTALEGPAHQQVAVGTGEMEELPAQLAIVSIGYKGLPLQGVESYYDSEKGVLRNEHGRIESATVDPSTGRLVGGLYTSGWLKRGPTGIIGTNIQDARDTVASILDELKNNGILRANIGKNTAELSSLVEVLRERNVGIVDWDGYRRIEERELQIRRSDKQPREKITSVEELVRVALSR